MTVIALLNTEDSPLLISDMLMSHDRGPLDENSIFIPTLGHLGMVETDIGRKLPFIATRMVRKAFAVGGTLHIAWAGGISAGEAFRKLIISHLEKNDLDQASLDRLISKLHLDQQKGFQVIVVKLPTDHDKEEWRSAIETYSFGCTTHNSPMWGNCIVGGSGAPQMLEWIQAREKTWATWFSERDTSSRYLGDLIVGKLVHSESLLPHVPSKEELSFNQFLSSGCGWFYEVKRFLPGGVVIPPTSLHTCFKYDQDKATLTRLYLYGTGINKEIQERMSFILCLNLEKYEIAFDGSDAHLPIESIDLISCYPFWLGTFSDHNYAHIPREDLAKVLSDLPEKYKAPEILTSALLDVSSLVLDEELAGHDEEMQLRILTESNSKQQMHLEEVNPAHPQFQIEVQNQGVSVILSSDFLATIKKLKEKLRQTPTDLLVGH